MRVAIVTGGARNIGLSIARQLARDGFRVAITARSGTVLKAAVYELESDGLEAFAVSGDVTDEASVKAAVQSVCDKWGGVDVLVNNAATRYHGDLASTSLQDWHGVINTTLTGAFLMTRTVAPIMKDSGWGRIVNIAGLSGQRGAAQRAALVSAKAGLIGFTKATALELAEFGVTANAISPGLIDTERPQSQGDPAIAAEHYRSQLTQVPVGRLGQKSEVAALCSYLCSEPAGFFTGQVLGINGGIYL